MKKWLTQYPIAHRGLHDHNRTIPENSIAAFAQAISKGYPIELDIQIISDGSIVVFHDSDLQRACGIPKKTKDLKIKDLGILELFKTSQKIPTLPEVLEFVNGQVPLLIELKTDRLFNRLLEKNTLLLLQSYPGQFALQSFNSNSVRWLQANCNYLIGQLAETSPALKPFNYLFEYVQLNKKHNPDFIGYDINLIPNKTVAYFKQKGTPILAWTVRSQQQLREKQHYFDTIIFEGFIPEINKL
jgi:glycerophosphoryl diester phosphodiesterase